MQLILLSTVTAFAATCHAAALAGTISCQDILIPVTATANNINLPSNLTLADLTEEKIEHISEYGTKSVSGQYTIGARYCAPSNPVAQRAKTLQVLVHGVTFTRDYWSGLAAPGTLAGQDQYSWIVYAGARGYPTLSIDRLCNGESSHPDGIAACQCSLETATVQSVIAKARAGQLPGVPTAFSKIVLGSHSYGSLVATRLLAQDPSAVDGAVITGFSYNITNALASFELPQYVPAARAEPRVYGNLSSSYYAGTNQTGTTEFYYYGDFAQREAALNFARRGTIALGETATLLLGQVPVPEYKGALLVLDGEEDANFCQTVPNGYPNVHPGNCSDPSIESALRNNYPKAWPFRFVRTPETGHLVNLHLTAQQSFAAAHDFLASAGF